MRVVNARVVNLCVVNVCGKFRGEIRSQEPLSLGGAGAAVPPPRGRQRLLHRTGPAHTNENDYSGVTLL